jgi:hypothetical protein
LYFYYEEGFGFVPVLPLSTTPWRRIGSGGTAPTILWPRH